VPFRRRSDADNPETTSGPATETVDETLARIREEEAKKGRPTPSRKESESANRRPIVVADRRSAARDARSKAKAERQSQYEAMRTNNTAKLPPRDQGPVREYIRDFVDARWNVGEMFLFAAFGLLVLSMVFSGSAAVLATVFMGAIYVVIILAVIDGLLLWRHLKRRIIEKFGEDKIEKGMLMYAMMRAFQIRRARLPKPKSKKHGNYPA